MSQERFHRARWKRSCFIISKAQRNLYFKRLESSEKQFSILLSGNSQKISLSAQFLVNSLENNQ